MSSWALALLLVGMAGFGFACGMLYGAIWVINRYRIAQRVANDIVREVDECLRDIDGYLVRLGLRRRVQ